MGKAGHARRRWWVVAALAIGVAMSAAVVAWLWWTAVPAASEAELAAALGWAGPADGRMAIAQPRRALRWGLRHRQVAALAVVIAPEARASLERLQPLLRVLAAKARGPLVVWWRDRDAAAAAQVRPGVARALALLAARANLPYAASGEVCRVATGAEVLAGGGALAEAAAADGAHAALAELGGRRWTIDAERSRLAAATGDFVATPERGAHSRVVTSDAAHLARALGLPAAGAGVPAHVVFAAHRGWGAALAGVELPGFLRRSAAEGAGAMAWTGLLGEVLVQEKDGRVLLATDAEMMAVLQGGQGGDEGAVRWDDLAWLAGDLAERLGGMPLLDREARALRQAARLAGGPGSVRWRLTRTGGRAIFEW